jgi:hypothetical protein
MKINKVILSVVLIVGIFGTIFTTDYFGLWKTKNSKTPATYQSGEFKGQFNPSDIRGSYTFGEISNLYNVPLDDLGNAFSVKSSFSSFECKDLESIYVSSKELGKEVGTDSVRIFVALYKGLPITLNENTYFPNTAEEILLKQGKFTDEQKTFISSHLVKPETSAPAKQDEVQAENPSIIKGKTTFKEILALGVKKEEIESSLNVTIEDTSAVIKTFCTEKGLTFSDVKAKIQTLIDQK